MYNDYYGYYDPSMPEDNDPGAEPEYQPVPNIPGDWVNFQEYDPIMPLGDVSYESPSTESNDDSRRPGRPAAAPDRPAAVIPDRPVAPLPDRPGRPIPDRPVAPLPDRPGRPIPDRPGRPIPDRPPYRPVPGSPVRPDWSWNWGFLLPGSIFPSSVSKVRFHNAAVREPVQIFVNNRLTASNINYMNYTRYYNVAPGRYRITIYRSSNPRTPLVDTWISVLPNTTSTVSLVRFGSQFTLRTRLS